MGLIFAKLCFLCMDTDRKGGGKLSVNQEESSKNNQTALKKTHKHIFTLVRF